MYESRFGITSEEMGNAAAALMHKAHWHAFTLLIDANLLPVKDLLRKEHPYRSNSDSYLIPRSTIYLPADERTLGTLLRRVAEENGRGSILILACDLDTAKKVIAHAGKLEMLAGRFLWLWLDLKGELRLKTFLFLLYDCALVFTTPGLISSRAGLSFDGFHCRETSTNYARGALCDKSSLDR